MTSEKTKTMQERLEQVRAERAHIETFDGERALQPGQLTPRQRIAALVDEGSFLEIGAFAKSQHAEVEAETPADGVITGYAVIDGRRAVVIAEDPLALARTDAQVGKIKRNRALSNAIYRRLPLVYLADGTSIDAPDLDIRKGALMKRVADQLPARDVAEREAPFVTIACGFCAGQDAALAIRADLLIATPEARFGTENGAPNAIADLVSADDESAIEAARTFLATLPTHLGTPLERIAATPRAAVRTLADEEMSPEPKQLFEALFDGEGAVLLGTDAGGCLAGLARIEGYPVAFALAGGSPRPALGTTDLKRIARVASWSATFGIPFVSTQDTLGYDPDDAGTSEFLVAAGRAVEALRASHAAKLTVITGWGHVLGDFALGGLGTGFDLIWCWPSGRVSIKDGRSYTAREQGQPPAEEPWTAAELGIVSELITPSETRAWLARALELLAPGRALPAAHYDRGQQIHDMT